MSFRTIGITAKPSSAARATLTEVIACLHQHCPQHTLLLDASLGSLDSLNCPDLRAEPLPLLCEHADLILCIGGDGTLLRLAQHTAPRNVPVLGINLGRLGYLVDISPQNAAQELIDILNGNYWIEQRLMLDILNPHTQSTSHALNEFLIARYQHSGVVEIEVYVDDCFVIRQRSDGLIISTPTGSTAYALSAGGPIISPRLGGICITPICPHTLSYRPLVIADTSHIHLHIHHTPSGSAEGIVDGTSIGELPHDSQIHIKKSALTLSLIHPAGYNEFEPLRSKLRWG